MYDMIIIGAGPAGMSAAIYARRAKKKVLVIEALSYGGQIINTLEIDNYPAAAHISGFDFATNLYNQAKELGADFVFEKTFGIEEKDNVKIVKTNNDKYEAKAVILAMGARNRKLGLENEEDYIGKGISYCATCDGAFFKGKDVAVVGGGNTALEDALYLSDIVNKVYLIHRRDEFRGEEHTIEEVKRKENVEILYNSKIKELKGEERLNSIIIDTLGKEKEIEISALFVAIGQDPANEIVEGMIDMDDYGYIIAGENCHTNKEGIFVAGDNRKKDLRQLVTATADGAIAATEAIKYINQK